MARPQVSRQIDFSKGVYANVNRYEQPAGSLHSVSNFVYDRDGALQTVDGSLVISSLNGQGPAARQQPIRFLVRYAETGFPQRIYALQPTDQNVNVLNVSSTSYSVPEIVLASTYDLPNAVQAGDTLAVALGAGNTPAILNSEPLALVAPWTNTWNANAHVPSWFPQVTVVDGQPVQPSTPNGHVYTCVQINQNTLGGLTGTTEPTWPTATGSTVTDGTVVWREAGIVNAPIPPGADFFFYHMGFLWAWGTNVAYDANNLDGPDALRMSDLNNFFSWNPLNATFLGKGDGQVAMGGAVMTLGEAGIAATDQIVLFKNNTSYIVLNALGPNAQVHQVPTGVGCVAPGTIAFIEEMGVVRLSERGITVFDGQNDSFQQLTAPIRAYLFGGQLDIMPVDWTHIRYAKACRVHNPPAYLLACPIASTSQANAQAQWQSGAFTVAGGATTGSFALPTGLPLSSSLYMTTSWDTSIWQTNTPSLATINWAVDTPAPVPHGTIYWLVASTASGVGLGALTRLFVYHIVLQTWAVVDLPFPISSLAFIPEMPFPAYTICGGTSDGAVRRLFAGDHDWDGVPIKSFVTIPEIGNPATPAYIKQIAINGRAKWSDPCSFTSTRFDYIDHSALIWREALYIAPWQIPVYVNIDKTVVSGQLRLNATGPMIIEGLEIAAQRKPFAAYDINRDGGYTTLNPPIGPPGSHGPTLPATGTFIQGAVGIVAGQAVLTIPLGVEAALTYFASISTSWNTTYWIANVSSFAVTIGFGTPAPASGGLVAYNVIGSNDLTPVVAWPVGAGSFFTNITLPTALAVPYTPVINPSWNTKFWITSMTSTGFTVAFDTPPPAGGVLYYTLQGLGGGGDPLANLPTTAGQYVWDGGSQLWVPATILKQGVTDGSNAAPGQIGEVIEQWGTGTGTTQLNDPLVYNQLIGSINITPGDWLIGGGFQMEEVAYPTSAVSSLLGDVNNLQEGWSWVVLRGVTGQDMSMTFNPVNISTATPVQVGIFLQVVTGMAPATSTFPYDWDIWARRMR